MLKMEKKRHNVRPDLSQSQFFGRFLSLGWQDFLFLGWCRLILREFSRNVNLKRIVWYNLILSKSFNEKLMNFVAKLVTLSIHNLKRDLWLKVYHKICSSSPVTSPVTTQQSPITLWLINRSWLRVFGFH